jgi:hypothetical protein
MAINPDRMSYLSGNNIRHAGRDQYLITFNDYADRELIPLESPGLDST